MVAWFIISILMILLFRLPFAPVQMMPFYLEFNPGIALIPLAGVFWGPAGVWGAFAATLLGDGLLGMWSELSIYRATGFFMLALTAQQLWYEPLVRAQRERKHRIAWRSTLRFITVAIPGCMISAVWTGLGSELLGLYPFPYLASLVAVHHIALMTLLAPAMYRVMMTKLYPRWGTWQDVMQVNRYAHKGSTRRAVSLWVGSLGGYAAGCFAGASFYQIWPFEPYVLGTTCGVWLRVLVIPFILLHLSGLISVRHD